jgi:hypothetical protein
MMEYEQGEEGRSLLVWQKGFSILGLTLWEYKLLAFDPTKCILFISGSGLTGYPLSYLSVSHMKSKRRHLSPPDLLSRYQKSSDTFKLSSVSRIG